MRSIYEFLGLTGEKALNYQLTSERIVAHVQRESKKKELRSELDNISNIVLRYSVKDDSSDEPFELQIIEIEIEEPKHCYPIIDAFADAIPYAVLLIFVSKDKYLLVYFDRADNNTEPYYCSNWIYEEELSEEFQPYLMEDDEVEFDASHLMDSVADNMCRLFSSFFDVEYFCLRRLIDILKIREKVWHNNYVVRVIKKLYDEGNIESLDNNICVVKLSYAEGAFSAVDNSWLGDRVLVDERFGVDHFYEKLTQDDATTIKEANDLFDNIVRGWVRPKC